PDGSTLFSGGSGSLVTSAGTWTFGSTTANGGHLILLNGQSAIGRAAGELEVANGGNLFADNSYGQLWEWNGSSWTSSTDPLVSSAAPSLSADGSTFFPGGSGSLLTSAGTWTFDSTTANGGHLILLNGQS